MMPLRKPCGKADKQGAKEDTDCGEPLLKRLLDLGVVVQIMECKAETNAKLECEHKAAPVEAERKLSVHRLIEHRYRGYRNGINNRCEVMNDRLYSREIFLEERISYYEYLHRKDEPDQNSREEGLCRTLRTKGRGDVETYGVFDLHSTAEASHKEERAIEERRYLVII